MCEAVFPRCLILVGLQAVCFDFIKNNFNEHKNIVKNICHFLAEKFVQLKKCSLRIDRKTHGFSKSIRSTV